MLLLGNKQYVLFIDNRPRTERERCADLALCSTILPARACNFGLPRARPTHGGLAARPIAYGLTATKGRA